MARRRRCAAPCTRLGLVLLAAAALPLAAPHADGAGSCRVADIHGTRSQDSAALRISVPTGGYDSGAAAQRVTVTLHCSAAACRSGAANNGFFLAAYNSFGAAVGAFDALPAATKRTCDSAVTHAMPVSSTNWTFSWSPAGADGPITFHAAVAVGHDISFLQRACLHDVRDGDGPMASEHAGHGRRRAARRLAAQTAVPVSDVYQACPGRSLPGPAGAAAMDGPVWSVAASTAPGAPLLFPGAALNSGGRFAGAVLATFAFAAASSAAGAWAVQAQARGAATGGPRWLAGVGAAAGLLRHVGHYGCMLISMTYNVWLLLALMGGHAAAYAATALATRRAGLRSASHAAADE